MSSDVRDFWLLVTGLVLAFGSAALVIRWMRRATPTHWSRPTRWAYLGFKWTLISFGGYACLGLAVQELQEKRVGIGTGVLFTVVFATIKALITVWTTLRHQSGPESPQPPARSDS